MKKFIIAILVALGILGNSALNQTEALKPVLINDVVYGLRSAPSVSWTEVDDKELALGGSAFRPSEFSTTLAESKTEGHSDTTLEVSSITTKDDHTLSASVLGDTIVLHIAPNRSNAEIVICTGLTAATKTFTSCTFGYRFDTDSTDADNIKAHAPGETVIISNDDHYLTRQFGALDAPATITGLWTVASSTLDIVKWQFTTSTEIYLWANKATGQFGFATSSTEYAFNVNGTTFTAVNPLSLTAGEMKLATSTYDFTLDSANALRMATTTIASGTASGTRFDDAWNNRWNATTTHPGAFTFGGNATTTGYMVIGTSNPTKNLVAGDLWVGNELCVGGQCTASSTGWFQLGETTFDGTTGSGTTTIGERLDLEVRLSLTGLSSPGLIRLRVNADTGNNYGWVEMLEGTASTSNNATSSLAMLGLETTEFPTNCSINISNRSGTRKLFTWSCVAAVTTGTSAPRMHTGAGVWNNTAQIISVSLDSTSSAISDGSRMTIYGKKD